MLVLGLKILVPLLPFALAVRHEWRDRRDANVSRFARRVAGRAVVAAVAAAGLVVDHLYQADAAAEEKEVRRRIEESMSTQAGNLSATLETLAATQEALRMSQEDAEHALVALGRIEGATAECAFGSGDPSWRRHADRALDILRHTTQIAGHHSLHSVVYDRLLQRVAQPR